jgi:hypothetical protein
MIAAQRMGLRPAFWGGISGDVIDADDGVLTPPAPAGYTLAVSRRPSWQTGSA